MDALLSLVSAVGVCALGAVVPWVSSEAVVVSAALLLPPRFVPLLVLGAALAQVAGKGTVYGLARWAPRLVPPGARARLQRISVLAGRKSPALAVLASSTLGVPPFFLVTLACGTLAAPLAGFLAAAFAGSLLRYGALSLVAVLVRRAA